MIARHPSVPNFIFNIKTFDTNLIDKPEDNKLKNIFIKFRKK